MTPSGQASQATAMEHTIDVGGVSKWFGSVVAINDVSLRVYPGITGLLGPNGAGEDNPATHDRGPGEALGRGSETDR